MKKPAPKKITIGGYGGTPQTIKKEKPGRKPIPAVDRKRPRSIALAFDEWNFVISEALAEGITVSAYISKLINAKRKKK